MDNTYPNRPLKNWWEERFELIECSKAFRELKMLEMQSIQEALSSSTAPLDVLQAMWVRQRYLLAQVKEENEHINHLKKC